MSDLNDLNKPTPTDTEPNVLDTLRAHIIRAATWSGWGSTANKVAGIMSGVTAAVSGGRSLRLYRRNDANTSDEEIVSLPGVSIGGNAATASTAGSASTVPWSGVTSKPSTRDGYGITDVPKSDGSGASGTWGVNISGNAATATTAGSVSSVPWSGVTSKPSTRDGYGITDVPKSDGSGASGTWGVSISGNAATATTAATATKLAGDAGGAPAFSCRAWVNFNGTGTVAIRASGNVSSITDNGVGDYTVNFATAMTDANYSVSGTCGNADTSVSIFQSAYTSAPTASACRVFTQGGFSGVDRAHVFVSIFR